MAACFNDLGNHGSRDDGSNMIQQFTVLGKTHINTVDKRTNPSLIGELLCGFGFGLIEALLVTRIARSSR